MPDGPHSSRKVVVRQGRLSSMVATTKTARSSKRGHAACAESQEKHGRQATISKILRAEWLKPRCKDMASHDLTKASLKTANKEALLASHKCIVTVGDMQKQLLITVKN